MKVHHHPILHLMAGFALLFFTSCASPAIDSNGQSTSEIVLEIITADGNSTAMTMDDLRALPTSTGHGGRKSSTGQITPPQSFKGVSLFDLVTSVAAFSDGMGISVEAIDGYAITFSYDQAVNGAFIQYDPGTGSELNDPAPLTAILAYEVEGQTLDLQEDGKLRIQIISDEPRQVVDGHWSVKFVRRIVLKSLSEDWLLSLRGTLSEEMDRATFESGASPNCHGTSWIDDHAQEWIGIPLWLLVGRVDDDVQHEGPAYNDALSALGYSVEIVASDGSSITMDSSRLERNDDIILAYLVNGNPLPDQYFPLRLVGADLEDSEKVGMVSEVIVHIEGMTIPTTTTEPSESREVPEGSLLITGSVQNELLLDEISLRTMVVVQVNTAQPGQDMRVYEGVRLANLLTLAGIHPGADVVIFTASDGYTESIFLSEIQSCEDCMLAFSETSGSYSLVMPDLPSSTWVEGVVMIEIR